MSEGRLVEAHVTHDRHFGALRYVYPVLSRRSRGISVGINLNPDKRCNFDCVYCQVDRGEGVQTAERVDVEALMGELERTLDLVAGEGLYRYSPFETVPQAQRVLRDVAFSGDGEATTCREFGEVVGRVIGLLARLGQKSVKLVLITNASQLGRESVREAVDRLMESGGEVWAKLDAGTEGYYQAVNRCATPLAKIVENITALAREHPVVIQSLFLKLGGVGPSEAELAAYRDRLLGVMRRGGRIDRVQIYTIARPPAEPFAEALEGTRLEEIASAVKEATGLVVETHGGLA